MFLVLFSYAVSFWIKCLVCCQYTMKEYAILCEYTRNIVARKIYNIKFTLVTVVWKLQPICFHGQAAGIRVEMVT
jgi:bacteriorhodopsin